MNKTRVHRRVLAEVPLEPHHPHTRVAFVDVAQGGERAVGRAVVDEDRLPVAPVEGRGHASVELVHGAFLVEHRDNNRYVHFTRP